MLRNLTRLLTLLTLLVGLSAGLYFYYREPQLASDNRRLAAEKKELQEYVNRLTDERRVAEILVRDQQKVDGVTVTDVLFQEIGRDGSSLAPKHFQVRGEQIYVTALSIRFFEEFTAKNDPQRGRGIILFDRIFGDVQAPVQGTQIDLPDAVPNIYGGQTKESAEFERGLWKKYWKLVSDKQYRADMGVEVASGKGAYQPLEPGKLYRLTLDARGNLSMDWEPLRPILLEAMRNAKSTTAPATGQIR